MLHGPAVAQGKVEAEVEAVAATCETGILDDGENGMNVLTYKMCLGSLTIGFQSSEIIEEISCDAQGRIALWFVTGGARCAARAGPDRDMTYELFEPLRGVGRATVLPVRQLLTCPAGVTGRATIAVPDARAAVIETRRGDSAYEKLVRRFVAACGFHGT
jgi:hypothetical protein